MKEIEANKVAWGLLSKEHYEHFKKRLEENNATLGSIIESEIGDLSGKCILHLQCNVGVDSVLLARKGAIVTGVDLVHENIYYARKLAEDFSISNISFIEADILDFKDKHSQKYDMVFTSEGVLMWLPDLNKWARTISYLLKDDGVLYVLDIHPFSLAFDETKLKDDILEIKYPYFKKEPDKADTIGGYASGGKEAVAYEWMHSVSDIINSLIKAGLTIEWFNEFDTSCYDIGSMESCGGGQYIYPFFREKIPFTFSLKANRRF